MAEATSIVFTPLEVTGTKRRALVTAVVSTNETITLSDNEYQVDTILSAKGHVAATGAAVVVAYATNVLTVTSTHTDASLVIEILY